jgi:hypothetical protein
MALCFAIIVGCIVICIGTLAVVVVVKAVQCLDRPAPTNDPPWIVSAPQGNTAWVARPWKQDAAWSRPAGAIAIQTSASLTNWQDKFYMVLTTNVGTVYLSTYDTNGTLLNVASTPQGTLYLTNEVVDPSPMQRRNFYRAEAK